MELVRVGGGTQHARAGIDFQSPRLHTVAQISELMQGIRREGKPRRAGEPLENVLFREANRFGGVPDLRHVAHDGQGVNVACRDAKR
eukprot:6788974-Pyramimonas_sp.AAC.1